MSKKKESASARETDKPSGTRRKLTSPENEALAPPDATGLERDQEGGPNALPPRDARTGNFTTVPPVLPPGTVVVVPKAAPKPTQQPAPDAIPPPPRPAAPTTSAPAHPPIQPASFQGGNVSTATPGVNPPARPTIIVQPTTPVTTPASAGTASDSQNGATASSPASVIVAPGRPASPGANAIPTPPSIFASGGGVASQGTLIAEILRLAAQSGAERDAADQAAAKAREKFVIDESKVKALRDRLYNDTEELQKKATSSSSPAVAEYSLDALRKARLMIVSSNLPEDLTQAEYLVERVRGRLHRATSMVPEGQFWNLVAILAWSFLFFLFCLPLAISFLYPEETIRFVNLSFKRDAIPFLAAFGWGGIGGVIGVFYNMTYFVQQRDYDPAYNLDYIVRPVKGFMVGGILMLISAFGSGAFGASSSLANPMAFGLVYLVAVLGGFKQEVIFDWFDAILKAALRTTSVKPTSPPDTSTSPPRAS